MSPTLVVLIGGNWCRQVDVAPGLVDFGAASGSVSVHLILSLDDRDALVQRLERRGDESARPAERYKAGLGRSAILIVEAVEVCASAVGG